MSWRSADVSGSGDRPPVVIVRGAAAADEVAAVLAALTARSRASEPGSRYEQWRRTRHAVLRVGRY